MVYGNGDGTFQQPYEPNNLPQYHPQNAVYQTVDMPYGNNSPAINALAGGYANVHTGVASPFEALMMGRVIRDIGGWGGVNNVIQDQDKMSAYLAQGDTANDALRMMQQGYGADEARYAATTKHLLGQGNNRAALGWTLPEYAKEADKQAARAMDTAIAAGGNYQSRGMFGYTPNGVQSIDPSQGTITVNGQTITDVSPEYLLSAAHGAARGDGSGIKNAANLRMADLGAQARNGVKLSDNEVRTREMELGAKTGVRGLATKSTKTGSNGLEYLAQQAHNKEASDRRGLATKSTKTGSNGLEYLAQQAHNKEASDRRAYEKILATRGLRLDANGNIVPLQTTTPQGGNNTGVAFKPVSRD